MNQSGALTLDFIFAFVLVLSMTLLLGVFSFSLAVIESAQYVAFSTSRAYFSAHSSQEEQRKSAEEKFRQLTQESGLNKFLKKDFIDLSIDQIGDNSDLYQRADDRDVLEGVRLKAVLNMLDIQIPGLGSTEGEEPYITYLTSFIGREPSAQECQNFMDNRYQALIQLDAYRSGGLQPGAYFSFEDNGC